MADGKVITITIDDDDWYELASQARKLGYYHGTVSIYLKDRIKQLCNEQFFLAIPPVERSWPKPKPERDASGRPRFIREGEYMPGYDKNGKKVA